MIQLFPRQLEESNQFFLLDAFREEIPDTDGEDAGTFVHKYPHNRIYSFNPVTCMAVVDTADGQVSKVDFDVRSLRSLAAKATAC